MRARRYHGAVPAGDVLMFGFATAAQQRAILANQEKIMATTKDLADAIAANTAAVQKLVELVPPAATELTQLRDELAATQPAIDAATAALTAQQPALDDAVATLSGAVANESAAPSTDAVTS
jgi:hypothetical protein